MTARRLAFFLLLAGVALMAPPAAAATRSYTGKLEIRHTDDFKRDRSTTRVRVLR